MELKKENVFINKALFKFVMKEVLEIIKYLCVSV